MKTPKYNLITPDKVFLPYFKTELTEAELWVGTSRNEFGNRPSGCSFIDCFAGIIRRVGYTNISYICKEMGVHPTGFQYTVMILTGMTPKEWIDWWTLSAICEMLEKTDWTIKKIAKELNFSSPIVLTTFFTRCKGIPPTEWRMQKRT